MSPQVHHHLTSVVSTARSKFRRRTQLSDADFTVHEAPYLRYPPEPSNKVINQKILRRWETKWLHEITVADHIQQIYIRRLDVTIPFDVESQVQNKKEEYFDVTLNHCIVKSINHWSKKMTVIGCLHRRSLDSDM